MSRIVVLNSQAHRDVRVLARPSARLGDDQRFVPVVVGEFSLLACHCPILFSKDSETGAFYCGAMLGFDVGENLFLDAGDGVEVYRPLNLQRGPFFTAGTELAIDLDHPRVASGGGETLFGEDGAPTPYLASIMALMRDLRPGMERTKVFIATLLGLKLIEPLTLRLSFDDGADHTVTDLYTVDQEALRALPDATALDLFRRGYLQLAYTMIGSLRQIPMLAQRKNRRLLPPGSALSGTAG